MAVEVLLGRKREKGERKEKRGKGLGGDLFLQSH